MEGRVVEVTCMFITPLGWAGGVVDGKVVAVKGGLVGKKYLARVTKCTGRICVAEPIKEV